MTNDDGGTPWIDVPMWGSGPSADPELAQGGQDGQAKGPPRGLADAPAGAPAGAAGGSNRGGDGGSSVRGHGRGDYGNGGNGDGDADAPLHDPTSAPCELLGIELRSFLVLHMLAAGEPVSVADLVNAVDVGGFAVAGRASKVVSDALRWEVARGRVRRLGRGLYCQVGRIPRSTLRRMKARVAEAAARSHVPVRVQPLRRPRPRVSPEGPWRYHRRYGLGPPRLPKRMIEADLHGRRRCNITNRCLARPDGEPSS